MIRRLLAGADVAGKGPPLDLAASRALHGPLVPPAELVALAEAVGLRGRGGAGFPVARKLRTARDARGRAVVVANCAEGEPAVAKDRALLLSDPHLVLDGAVLAAQAVGAREVVLAAHAGPVARELRRAVAEREERLRVVELQPGYVRSEASAVVSAVRGGPGLPQSRTTPLAVRGPGRRPWLVQNAETLASLAVLARLGADRFAEVGTAEEPGTALLTVRGAVRAPRVVEAPLGTPLAQVLAAAGGPSALVPVVLLGGFAGRWVPCDPDLPLSRAGTGGALGAGLVVALPSTACGLATTAVLLRHLAGQSARQCGPCLNGLPALAQGLEDLVDGRDAGQLDRWAALVAGRGACAHPDGAVGLLRSALEVFAGDRVVHRAGGCGRPALDLGVPA